MSSLAVNTTIPATPAYTVQQLEAFALEPWNDPRPFRDLAAERQEGVSVFRGLLFATIIGVSSWALLASAVAGVVTLFRSLIG